MVRRNKKVQKGGSVEDVNSISTFTPTSIPGLALWIKVSKESLTYSTLADYIRKQSITVQQTMKQLFANNLDDQILTEITGVGNSLVRFELDSSESESFPTYLPDPSGNDAISLTFNNKSFKLATKTPVTLQNKYSMFSTSQNITYEYIPSFNKFILGPDLGAYIQSPVAKFSEIIVYSRELNRAEKEQVEGYLAYINDNQYALPINHPYLPDMSYTFKDDITNINIIKESIKSANHDLTLSDNEPALKGRLTDALHDISFIYQTFSKGALLAKKSGPVTMDSIYTSANSLNILTVPFTRDFVAAKLSEFTVLLTDVHNHIESTKVKAPDTSVEEEADQLREMEAAQTEQIFEATQLELQAREFYEGIRARSERITINGTMSQGNVYKNFDDTVSTFSDAILYSNKKLQDSWTGLKSIFAPIEKQINSREWLKYIPAIDISESEVIKRGGETYSIQYRDTYLNSIQSQYQRIRAQIYDGDMAYIYQMVPKKADEIAAMYKAIQEKKVQPIMIKTFLPHFKQRYNEISKYMDKFNNLIGLITTSIQTIASALDYSKKNATVSPLDDLPTIPTHETLLSECETVYVRLINSSDATLTGIEYIVTDVEGNIQNSINADGEIDVEYIFPSYMNVKINKEDMMFVIYQPYKDDSGHPIRLEYKILEPLPRGSIINSLSTSRRPNYWFHKADSLFEIPRDQINGIHQFIIEHAQYPIQLPKYAVDKGSYFLIQNIGVLPIQIQIPGFPDDHIDMIGSNELMLYIYSGLSTSYGNAYYGRVPWREGYIPYDTLLNAPRSAYSAFIKELNQSVFIKKNLEPLLDSDGYFVKAVVDSKGYTYDIDDIYKANPYSVQAMNQMNISDLKAKGSRLSIRPVDPQIWVLSDIITGLPVLCNSKGIPGMNEFGFCKFVKTPIMLINDHSVITGAFGDIPVRIAPTLQIEQMGVLEPFLKFDTVYRSKFVQSYLKGDVKTFIFTSLSKYPILSPKYNFIEAERWLLMPPQEITYMTVNDISGVAYISKDEDTLKDSPINAAPYPYISVQDTRMQIEMKKAAKIILNRYVANQSYILECLDNIKTTSEKTETLGKSASEGTVEVLATASKTIQAYYDKYMSYESSVEPIQASLDADILTNALKISIDMLDMKMKDLVESVAGTYNSILGAIETTSKILADIESIETATIDLRVNSSVEIENLITSVKGTMQADAQNLKITGSPEFDRLLKLMIKHKVEFLKGLGQLEPSLKVRPEYITEYSKWTDDKKQQIKVLNGLLVKVRVIEQTDIPRVFVDRSAKEQTKLVQTYNEMVAQLAFYKKYKQIVGQWIGIPESADYNTQAPVINTGDPAIKGLSIDLVVFNELANPSVSRDWQADGSPEIAGRIFTELLNPIETLKNNNDRTFMNNLNDLPDITGMDMAGIQRALDIAKLYMDKTTADLMAFESALEPILKSYESIRSNLRAEIRQQLTKNNQTIRDRWTSLSSKRIAIQTILSQRPDAEKEATLESLFGVEIRVSEIIVNSPTSYDTLSYFQMKELRKKQENMINEFALIDIAVGQMSKEIV